MKRGWKEDYDYEKGIFVAVTVLSEFFDGFCGIWLNK